MNPLLVWQAYGFEYWSSQTTDLKMIFHYLAWCSALSAVLILLGFLIFATSKAIRLDSSLPMHDDFIVLSYWKTGLTSF